MSAIFGVYFIDGKPVKDADLDRMGEALAHRGGDGAGVWNGGTVGLGHRMLWTTPESLRERLPFANSEGNLAITADARLDNRDELIKMLGMAERPSPEITDSDLILAAYEQWGEECPERLLGDFAFAIWDARKQQLFCARDHFGVKPFYYYASDTIFAFATEIKALICLAEVPSRLNQLAVADLLEDICDDKEITFYKGILRIAPAHAVTITSRGLQKRVYWSLDPSRELKRGSDAEYAEEFRDLFTEAVRCRLRSAFPIGSMLSGGLDSSSITCVAREILSRDDGPRLQTFSAVFDIVNQCDERKYIDAVIAQNGIAPHYFQADGVSPMIDLERMLWHQDQVVTGGNTYINWCLYELAQKQGVRVVLEGFDGDTTVSHGTGYLIELARAKRWIALVKEARGYARHFQHVSSWKLAWWHIERHGLSPGLRQSVRLARRAQRAFLRRLKPRSPVNHPEAAQFLNQSLIRQIELERGRPEQPQKRVIKTERLLHYNKLNWAIMPEILELLNKTAGAFSIENRFPFWDRRLAEFCLALPPEQKMHDGWIRIVLRRAMDNILPPEVQWRGGKGNLSPGVEHGLLAFERDRIAQVILKDSRLIQDYFDVPALREAHDRFTNGGSTEGEIRMIWKAVLLAHWLQRTGLRP